MNAELTVGKVLSSSSGNSYKVEQLLGEGGQGYVYEVSCNGNKYAMKWYKGDTQSRPEQKAILENLLQKSKPSDAFLWPLDLVFDGNLYGYVMPLRPSRFKDIPALMSRKADPSFKTLCKIGFNLVTNYRKLHASGYSYCDINFGNVFFDPNNGDVLICDNDNVTIDGMKQSLAMGTLGFMAPELVMACETHSSDRPSTATDLHSLAVLLFYIFMIADPFQGEMVNNIKCFDQAAKTLVYGKKPVFIFDPNDKSNRPVKGVDDNATVFWNLYPDYFKDLFVRTLADGLHNPNKRVQEVEWQNALIRMMDGILTCQNCGAESFYNEAIESSGAGHICWYCSKSIQIPTAIRIGSNKIILNSDATITEHHVKDNYNVTKIVATVSQNPKDPSIKGVKNESSENWVYEKVDGTQVTLPPGKSATIAKGCKIKFGQVEGVFE